jgi:hypothetical protein
MLPSRLSAFARFVSQEAKVLECLPKFRVAPKIWPAVIHQPLHGVIGAVRIRTELDLIDVEGTIIDIRTSQSARKRGGIQGAWVNIRRRLGPGPLKFHSLNVE